MNPSEPPNDCPPDPKDPDFLRALDALHTRAERSKVDKARALQEWSREETDEKILNDFGLNMNVLREDP